MLAIEVLADPTRRRIVEFLGECERRTVSRHLRVLHEHGLGRARGEAQRRIYSLDPEPLEEPDICLARHGSSWARRLDGLAVEIRRSRRRWGACA